MPQLLQLDGLEVTEQVYESSHSRILKTRRTAEGPATLLKVLKADSPSQKEIVRFHQEYSIAKRIESPYVAKVLGMVNRDHLVALRIEDIDALSLASWLQGDEPPSLSEGLEIAIAVCRGLRDIHQQRIAHKDISSSNIIWNRKTNQVQIIDFGISSVLDKDFVQPESPQQLDGNLAYMSPEQTGRMNRPVDFRTDFYSLGVTLYELFSGQKPFSSPDPLELIHCHIAKSPPPPGSVNANIPPMIGRIILKLLEKSADNRYQSAGGIEWDLNEVLQQLRNTGSVADFVLAQHDRSDWFLIPSRLYGRDADVAKLISSFERACGGEMVLSLVSGYSGVGKSSLVQELYRPLAVARGRYITGKFDQYQRDVPYSALAYAFNGFCDQVLAESTESVEQWRERILKAVGNNGQVLIEIVPRMEDISGPQPGVPAVDPQASRNRFNQVLLSFVSEICRPAEPLVLFLDDLQWIDQASLELLKQMLLHARIPGLHLVGAYRDNEVKSSHPLTLMLGALHSAGQSYDAVHLSNLTPNNITDLVADTLGLDKSEITDLVDIICHKTQGNAFFATEFFKNLHARHLLTYLSGRWRWDRQAIEDENITENVVEFMAGKLREFGAETQRALKFGASIGNEFNLRTLSIILESGSGIADVLNDIRPAIHSGVIRSRNDDYKKVGIVDVGGELITFKFQHDRIQQAAYSLIPADDRPRIHFQIGRLWDEDARASGDLDNRLFEIVSHLNQALPVVTDADERLNIAELNLQAGVKAQAAAAYQASTEYFLQARSLLPSDAFGTHYALALKIHLDLARSLYINGEFDKSECIYPVLLAQVNSPMDEVRIRMVQMEDYHLQGDYEKAIDVQKKGLALLGEAFPEDLEASIVQELEVTPHFLGRRSIDELLAAPELDSEGTLAKLRILVSMWMSAYLVSNDPIVQWCSIKMTNLTLRDGNSEFAAFAYVQYGYICVLRLKRLEEGWQYGDLAVRLADRYNNIEMRGRVYFNFAIFVNHWTKHISTSTDLFRQAYLFSIEGGDWTYAVYGAANIISNLLIEGRPCADVLAEGKRYLDFLGAKAEVGLKSFFLGGGYVPLLNLVGQTRGTDSFDCEYLNEVEHLNALGKLPIVEAWFYSAKLRSLFLYRHLDQGQAVCHKADIVCEGVPSQIKVPEAYFHSCLIIAATWDDLSDPDRRRQLRERFDRYADDIREWSEHCPDNFLHKHLLIRAEESRFEERPVTETLSLYDAAIEAARKSGYTNNVALALELKGRFWLERSQPAYALIHLRDACREYENWGVTGKQSQLQEEFPELSRWEQQAPAGVSALHTGTVTAYQLDLESIYKSAQAISRKVAWNDLIESMLSIVIENVGANRGLLLFREESDWMVEARAHVDQTTGQTVVSSGRNRLLEEACPVAVLNYVMNSRQPLILDSNQLSEPFTANDYFQQGSDLSIICSPVMLHDELKGLLYLENNLSAGVFNKERARILDVLMSQISISLENARLYEELERRVAQRTDELARSNKALEESNTELQQFAYVASHDLQEPLRAVSGYCELLDKKYAATLEGKAREWLANAVEGAQRMQALIHDLLQYSRIGQQDVSFQTVDLTQVAQQAFDRLKVAVAESHAQVQFSGLPSLNVDRAQLTSLFQNLIGNALKYRGDAAPEVHIIAEERVDEWLFSIQDNGIGIDPEYWDRIFQIFQRLHTRREYSGTGIGLAICKRIVERHGGRIWVKSEPGLGSTFFFTLPKK